MGKQTLKNNDEEGVRGTELSRKTKMGTQRLKNKNNNPPPHVKYPRYSRNQTDGSDEVKATPSMLLEEMDMGQQPTNVHHAPPKIIKLFDLGDSTCADTSIVPLDEPIFQPYPLKMQFREYVPFSEQTQTLWFRNNDCVPRRLKIIKPDSPYFSVVPNPRRSDRVAPGMEVSFQVTFRPAEKQDYKLGLVCVTEREEFVVEISALGRHSYLDFPDEVLFGRSPVRHRSSRTFLVRNKGELDTKFVLESSSPFVVTPKSGFVPIGGAVQVTVDFIPTECVEYDGELKVIHQDGRSAYVRLNGSAENINVRLDQPVVQLEPAYITLASFSSFKIQNRSNVPVNFQWRAYSTEEEEFIERERLHAELDALEQSELERIQNSSYVFDEHDVNARLENLNEETGDDLQHPEISSASNSDDEETVPFSKARDMATVAVKYKNLHKAVDEDPMHFADENFQLEPMTGVIWPDSEIEIRTTFQPTTAADFACIACLEIDGRETRLPLKMLGTGIGPKAGFSFDVVDVGDVFLNSEHMYELYLDNHGDIDCTYRLREQPASFGPQFDFNPKNGVLAPGESDTIRIHFRSEVLGEFSENFVFELKGSNNTLKVHFKGHVIGPTFHLDVDELDFGRVAYDLKTTKVFHVFNTSDIEMKYRLRINQDGKGLKKEFEFHPRRGCIEPGGMETVTVDFCSNTVQSYDTFLAVDVEEVGDSLLSIPVRAVCAVADITLGNKDDEFQFGECFIHHPYEDYVILRNNSDLAGQYEIVRQDEASRAVAIYQPESFRGTVPPMSEVRVKISVSCERLGNISLPLYIKIGGSEAPPLLGTIVGNSRGPLVILNQTYLDWSNVQCLNKVKRKLLISNSSLIPASFTASVKNPKSVFSVEMSSGLLAPHETLELEVYCTADDTIQHKDTLEISIRDGKQLTVPLMAKGIGTTMFCQEDLRLHDFENVFTTRIVEKKFLLENRGRRKQTLTWVNVSNKQRESERHRISLEIERLKRDKNNTESKKKLRKLRLPDNPTPVFRVFPETIDLKPKTGCYFTLYCESSKAGPVIEQLVLESKVGKAKGVITVLKSDAKANLIVPLLQPSQQKLSFEYTCPENAENKDGQQLLLHQSVELRNVTALPLNFILRTQEPFSVDTFEISLEPDETTTVNVLFDPLYKDDRQSQVIDAKLLAIHQNHPQKDSIDLHGKINFPNLEFETTKVEFGSILSETSKSVEVKVTNTSAIPARYSWLFLEDQVDGMQNATDRKPFIALNKVFDILPIRGELAPGESQMMEFVFYGHPQRKFRGVALCEVSNGPSYEIELLGEASQVSYKIDKDMIDLGEVVYDSVDETEMVLHNTGKVAFSFNISPSHDDTLGFVQCIPSRGRIASKDSQRITVRCCSGMPEKVVQYLTVEVAHLEPFEIPVYSQGTFSCITLSLPRVENSDWDAALSEVKDAGGGQKLTTQPSAYFPPRSGGSIIRASFDSGVLNGNASGIGPKSATGGVGAATASDNVVAAAPPPARGGGYGYAPTVVSRLDFVSSNPTSVEAEADRLYFLRYLQSDSNEVNLHSLKTRSVNSNGESTSNSSTRAPGSSSDRKRNRERNEAGRPTKRGGRNGANSTVIPATPATTGSLKEGHSTFVVAKYIANFGNVVVGMTRKKAFRLTNNSPLSLTFEIDRSVASALGFSVEPSKVVRLPENESIDFTIQYTARKDAMLGLVQVDIPVIVKHGPSVHLALRANVTIPEISINTDSLDFGNIHVGQCRTSVLQLKNTSPIPAEWSLKTGVDAAKSKDLTYFEMKPNSGTIPPGKAMNLEIAFTPRESRLYQVKLLFKVNQNPRMKHVSCRGEASDFRLQFSPPMVTLKPTLPHSAPVEATTTLVNHTAQDIEVYSVDFDTQYLEEERILARYEGFRESGMGTLRFLPRMPGDGLPEAVLEAEARRLKREEEEAARAQALEAGEDVDVALDDNGEVGELDNTTSTFNGNADSESLNDGNDATEPSPRKSYRDAKQHLDLIIHGPPMSGKTTLASELSIKHGFNMTTIDKIVKWANEQVELNEGDEPLVPVGVKQLLVENSGNTAPPPAKKKGKDPKTVACKLDTPSLCKILNAFLDIDECDKGIVLDSIISENQLVDQEVVLEALEEVFKPRNVTVVSPDDPDAHTTEEVEKRVEQLSESDETRSALILLDIDRDDLSLYYTCLKKNMEAKLSFPVPVSEKELVSSVIVEEDEDDEEGDNQNDEEAAAQKAALLEELRKRIDRVEALCESVDQSDSEIAKYYEELDPLKEKFSTEPIGKNEGDTNSVGENSMVPGAMETPAATPRVSKKPVLFVRVRDLVQRDLKGVASVLSASDVLLQLEERLPHPGTPLPDPEEENRLPIPPPCTYQLVRQPLERAARLNSGNFSLLTVVNESDTAGEEVEQEADDQVVNSKTKKSKDTAVTVEPDTTDVSQPIRKPKTRWIIPAFGSVEFVIQFSADKTGKFEQQLAFEVIGGRRQYWCVAKGTCAIPTISSDPRNVFMTRSTRPTRSLKNAPVSAKRYFAATGTYEFGPLLVGKDPDNSKRTTSMAKTNGESLRISNSGILPIDLVSFSLLHNRGTLKAGTEDSYNETPFYIEPTELSLDIGETKEVKVWAIPQHCGKVEDSLICCIKDNPDVTQFPVSCVGASPTLSLEGSWNDKYIAKCNEAAEAGLPVPAKPELPVIDFDRLLLNRSEDQSISLVNTSEIPVAWVLESGKLETELTDFVITPKQGILPAGSSVALAIQFTATTPVVHEEKIAICFSDTEGGMEDETRMQRKELLVKAEAYNIQVEPNFGTEKNSEGEDVPLGRLAFDQLHVFESASQTFTLRNAGKYPVKFEFRMNRRMTKQLFQVSPMSGELDPDGVIEIKVTFDSNKEVRLRDYKDIKCAIMEIKTGEVFETFDVPISACSVFSKCIIQPKRSLNFGAVMYGTTPERFIEIKNDGEFDFSYQIFPSDDVLIPPEKDMTELDILKSRALPDSNIAKVNEKAEFGGFCIEPAAGVVSPGQVQRVGIIFNAQDQHVFRQRISIVYSGRDPEDFSDRSDALSVNSIGVPFVLVGESCTPGINTENIEAIFEEQTIVRTLHQDSFITSSPTLPESGSTPSPAGSPTAAGTTSGSHHDRKSFFATESNVFSFGAVIPTSLPPNGLSERFKISNPKKVKATVNFAVEPRNAQSTDIFEVQPAMLELPPHEYQYVTVYFKPSEMRDYAAKFTAEVVDGSEDSTRLLEFDLQGEGTLPCVTVVEPCVMREDARLLIDFGRLHVGKSNIQSIVVRNDGIVPATLRFDASKHDAFNLALRGSSMVLAPKEVRKVSVDYCPQVPGNDQLEILLRVLHNEYEMSRIVLNGIAYKEDITFENLPESQGDTLLFGDVPLHKVDVQQIEAEEDTEQDVSDEAQRVQQQEVATKSISFTLKSHSDQVVRFSFPKEVVPENSEAENNDNSSYTYSFFPSLGHIPPYGEAAVTATFSANNAVSHVGEMTMVCGLKIEKIRYNDDTFAASNGEPITWTGTVVEATTGEDDVGMVKYTAPEPSYVLVNAEEEPALVKLRCCAVADRVSFEIPEESQSIAFRETMMYQSRVYHFPVRNNGKIALNYRWKILDETTGDVVHNSPFSLTPDQGVIPPEGETNATVRYSPIEVENFHHQAVLEIVEEGVVTTTSIVSLTGTSSRPVCHFDLETSDYLERRKMHTPEAELNETKEGSSRTNSNDPERNDTNEKILSQAGGNVRVVEIESLGIKVRNTARFNVVNPMNASYEYMIEPVGKRNGRFKCQTAKGRIDPGRRCQIAFEFTPTTVALQESLWHFSIPMFKVSQLFLVVGHVVEPNVEFDRKHLNFNAVLVGGHTTERVKLRNLEHIPFGFEFDPTCLVDIDGQGPSSSNPHQPGGASAKVLSISPMSGSVPANGELVLEIKFAPQLEKSYNFNLACNVRRKPMKISLNVKGEGSAVHDELLLVDDAALATSHEPVVLTSGGTNYLDFGHIHINDNATRTVNIRNNGRFNFDFVWTSKNMHPSLRLYPLKGTVHCGETVKCNIDFSPTAESSLQGVLLECLVAGARKYPVVLSGQGNKPALSFSFYRHDFGPCFVQPENRVQGNGEIARETDQAVLRIANNETEADVAIDCTYERTPYLDVPCTPTVLKPGDHIDVPIMFSPQEMRPYTETIPFEINGLYTVNVVVTGIGTALRLELERAEHHNVNFGALRVRQEAQRHIRLVNRSKKTVSFALSDVKGRLEEQSVYFSGSERRELHLKPREAYSIDLQFRPTQRLAPFSEVLMITVLGMSYPLLTVSGSCQGVDVTLESDSISFGTVCAGCFCTRKLQVQNAGDIGTTFKWDTTRPMLPHFDIFPSEGYLPPHSQLMFDVTFQPAMVYDDFRCEAVCLVEGADNVSLTMSGECTPQPTDGITELTFETKARQVQMREVEVENPTRNVWHLKPAIQNDCWTGPERLEVPPQGKAVYKLTYCPLTMTKEGTSTSDKGDGKKKGQKEVPSETEEIEVKEGESALEPSRPEHHRGSLFLALPNGKSIMYNLVGISLAPDTSGLIEKEANAKESIHIQLPVKNWLKVPQRFQVKVEQTSGSGASEIGQHLFHYKGPHVLDVPAHSSRDYKMTFNGLVEGTSEATVTFTNVITGEFLFYDVKVECKSASIVDQISLVAPVRQSVSHTISIQNPLPTEVPVTFSGDWWNCDDPCVRIRPLTGDMTGKQVGRFQLDYRPLVLSRPDEINERKLTIKCDQLGEYHYILKLQSTKANVERSMAFSASLGGSQEHVFRFRHFVESGPVEFSCSVGQKVFFNVEPKFKAEAASGWNGSEVAIPVTFEPQALGEIRDELVVTSLHPYGGEYRCTLHGTCDPPRPKGPFVIAPGKEATIEFKNVFHEKNEFRFTVDNEAFVVAAKSPIMVEAQQTTKVVVKFNPSADATSPVLGKLLVDCVAVSNLPPWVFYLKGLPNGAI